jgi:hypothetical protein
MRRDFPTTACGRYGGKIFAHFRDGLREQAVTPAGYMQYAANGDQPIVGGNTTRDGDQIGSGRFGPDNARHGSLTINSLGSSVTNLTLEFVYVPLCDISAFNVGRRLCQLFATIIVVHDGPGLPN